MVPPPSRKKRRWLRRFAWFFSIVLLLAVIFYFTRDFWEDSFNNYVTGRIYVAALDNGPFLPEVDEVEILALGGYANEGDPDSFQAYGNRTGTVNRLTVHGDQAAELANLWREIPVGGQYLSLCFSPYYALRFRNHGKLILETAVCWHCSTYTLPVPMFGRTEYGFYSGSKPAQDLLAKLTLYAPHPAPSKKPQPATPAPSP